MNWLKIRFIKNFNDVSIGDYVFTTQNSNYGYKVISLDYENKEYYVVAAFTTKINSKQCPLDGFSLEEVDERWFGNDFEQHCEYTVFKYMCHGKRGATMV